MEIPMSSYSSKMHLAAIAIIMFAAFAAALPGVKMETRLVEYYTTLAYYTTVPIYYADPSSTYTSAVSSLETKTFHVVYTEEVLVTSKDELPSDLSTSTYATPISSAVSESMFSENQEVETFSGASFEPISSTSIPIESDFVPVPSEYNDQSTEISSSFSAIVGSSASTSIITESPNEPGLQSLFANEMVSVFDEPKTSAEPSPEAYLSDAEESGVSGEEVSPEPTETSNPGEMIQSTTYSAMDEVESLSTASESLFVDTLSESPTSWVSELTEEPGMEIPETSEPGIEVSETLESYSAWSYSTTFTESVPSEFLWDLEDPEGAYQRTQDEFPMFPGTWPSYTTEDNMVEQPSSVVTDSGENFSVTSSPVPENSRFTFSSSVDDLHYHSFGTIEEPVWESVSDLEPSETVDEKFAKLTAAPSSIESEPGLEPTITNSESSVTSAAGSSDPAESRGMFTPEALESAEPISSVDYDSRDNVSVESGASFFEGYDVTDDAIARSTTTSTEDFFTDAVFDESLTSTLSSSLSTSEAYHQSTLAVVSSDLPEDIGTFKDSSVTAGEASETGMSQSQSSVVPLNTLSVSANSSILSVPDESSRAIGPASSTSSTWMIQTSSSENIVVSSSNAAVSKVMVDTKREIGSDSTVRLATPTAAEPGKMTESGMPLVSVPDEHVATHTSSRKCDCCQCPAISATPIFVDTPSVQVSETAFPSSIAEPNIVTPRLTQDAVVVPTETDTTTFLDATSSSDPEQESIETVQIDTEEDVSTPIVTRAAVPPLATLVPTETAVLPLATLVPPETAILEDAERIEPILVDTVMSDFIVLLPETSTDPTSVPTTARTTVQSLGESSVTTEAAPVQSIVTVMHTLAPEQPPYVPPENPFRGDATFFYPDMGACGWVNSGNDLVAAVNKDLFDKYAQGSTSQQNPLCGMKVNAHYGERSVAVSVVDTLGAGNVNDLGLSPMAFAQLADKRKKKIKVTWDLE
ncbi:hypothetical protein OXX79_007144 [Metschnikowia pulcherrima]